MEPECKIEYLRKKIGIRKLRDGGLNYVNQYNDKYSIIQYTSDKLKKEKLREDLTLFYYEHYNKLTFSKSQKREIKEKQKSVEKTMSKGRVKEIVNKL